jgi:inner membrane protein
MNSSESFLSSLQSSQLLRLLAIGVLALLLQIPISMIAGLVTERQARRAEAVEDVTSKWGRTQQLTGPVLVVPYVHRWMETNSRGAPITREEPRHAVFLPDQLDVKGELDSESRQRGIFSVPVYELSLVLSGVFRAPDLVALGIDPKTVDWKHVHLALGISDVRAVRGQNPLTWRSGDVELLPGTGSFACGAGIHARVDASGATPLTFSLPLALAGSIGAYFTPFGRETTVALTSNAKSPSFQGSWLPTERNLSSDGFRASWSIPFLGRGFPQAWTSKSDVGDSIAAARFGVDLLEPVDHYRMAERSVKYAGLFILWTFSAVWLVEVLARVRVHPIQYLLIGAALCVFYVLELSLAEHLGFATAYALASAAVISLIGTYARAILGRTRRALVVTGGAAALYAYLYVVLTNEDYALLAGSLGLLAVVAGIMFVTRRVDWYQLGAPRPSHVEPLA